MRITDTTENSGVHIVTETFTAGPSGILSTERDPVNASDLAGGRIFYETDAARIIKHCETRDVLQLITSALASADASLTEIIYETETPGTYCAITIHNPNA